MPETSRVQYSPKDVDVEISEIGDGIYRIAGFDNTFGITYNQFLVNDEKPMLVHTGPIGMYTKVEDKRNNSLTETNLCGISTLRKRRMGWNGTSRLCPCSISM